MAFHRLLAMLGPWSVPAQSVPENRRPSGEITVRVTTGTNRFVPDAPLHWQSERGSSEDSIRVDPARKVPGSPRFWSVVHGLGVLHVQLAFSGPPHAIIPGTLRRGATTWEHPDQAVLVSPAAAA